MLGRGTLFILGVVAALGARPAIAEDLDAGKSGPRLFASNCSACHRSPRGLAKGHSAGSLQGFLRQHYSTGPATAAELAAYLAAVGGDSRRVRQRPGVGEEQPAATRSQGREPDAASPRRPRATGADPSGPRDRQRRERAGRPPAEAASAEPAIGPVKPQSPVEAVHAAEPPSGRPETADRKSMAPSAENQPDQSSPASASPAPSAAQTAAVPAAATGPRSLVERAAAGEGSLPNPQPTFSAPSP